MSDKSRGKLAKTLTLFDVYAISTGAMFSSGFFLLPGIAASYTGPSAYLAYLTAGFLILPAMLSMAELSTAMPKAGGTYFFLDRSLGPLMGTVGGLGSWVAVVFKSAFALVGMGAYLALYIDVPITLLAVILTVVFGLVNVFGAKETTALQRLLVATLVSILAAFVIKGLIILELPEALYPRATYGEFFRSGVIGFVTTIGLVFVSYAGLTKVASVAEEVENPDRNIPLGMTLSLITATLVYTLGMMVMINVLPAEELYASLTPVADAGRQFLDWMPYDLGVILIVVAAIAAFASTGNAGILSASRYPFAMAKDKLVPNTFSHLGRFGTPTLAITATVLAMVAILLLLDVESVAKLASAFQLFLFGLVSVSVIVMRESRIEAYKPGFRAPFYPWLQIAGLLISFWLIVEMGILAIGFTGMLTIACAVWYQFYAAARTERSGAIFHVHARLGANRYEGLERELMGIIHERTKSENLSFESLIARCTFINATSAKPHRVLEVVSERLAGRTEHGPAHIEEAFGDLTASGQPLGENVMIWYRALDRLEQPELVIVRLPDTVEIDVPGGEAVHTLMFLIAPRKIAGLDLRLAGHLAEIVQSEQFVRDWLDADLDRDRREILMRDDHFLHVPASAIPLLVEHFGQTIGDIDSELPGSCLIALIERGDQLIIAKPHEVLLAGDEVAIIGEPEDLEKLGATPVAEIRSDQVIAPLARVEPWPTTKR
ncbi:MAG: amino acid permease [Acidobacteriota bacterium]